MYQMYTLPTCEHCREATELMKQRRVQFELINVGSSEGIKKFRELYAKYREQIKRDDSGCALLPVTLYQSNGNARIYQGRERLEKFLDAE